MKWRIFHIILALIFLSLAQGLFLLLVGPLMKALLGFDHASGYLYLSELMPANLVSFLPQATDIRIAMHRLIIWIPLLMVITGVVKSFCTYIYHMNQNAIALYVAKSYRDRLFEALLTLPFVRIAEKSAAHWMSLVMNDVFYLQARFSDFTSTFIRDGVLIVSALIVIAMIHLPTACVLLVTAPIIAMLMGTVGKRIAQFANAWQKELGKIAAAILDIRARFFFIRAQSAERLEELRFRRINNDYYRMIRKSIFIRSAFAPSVEFIGFFLFAAFIYAVGKGYWINTFGPMQLIQFFAALGVILRPLRNLGEQLGLYQETKGALKASFAILCEQIDQPARPRAMDAMDISGKQFNAPIDISQVQSGYNDKIRFSAQNIVIEPGKAVAIVGPSGAGKSTLIKTLAGLIEPMQWEASIPIDKLWDKVSFVSQTPFLFDDSLLSNLTYELSAEVDTARLWSILQTLNVDEEVNALTRGLDTHINSVNSNLSGGQLQRLVIARALLRDKCIWLLDEATSAIDARSEKDITQRVIGFCHNSQKSLLAITHRLTWLHLFDEVWFIEDGALMARGPHLELMRLPRYAAFAHSSRSEKVKKEAGSVII